MLLVESLAGWVGGRLLVATFQIELPDREPSRAIAVADTGGLALRVEGYLDVPTFQFLIRAEPNNVVGSRDLAFAVDRLIVNEVARQTIGGVFVTDAGRVGGRPQPLGQDDRGRWVWSGNYWIESGRS